jgi:hypothetical protein
MQKLQHQGLMERQNHNLQLDNAMGPRLRFDYSSMTQQMYGERMLREMPREPSQVPTHGMFPKFQPIQRNL